MFILQTDEFEITEITATLSRIFPSPIIQQALTELENEGKIEEVRR